MRPVAFILILFMGAFLTSGVIIATGGTFSMSVVASYLGGIVTTALIGMIPRPFFNKKNKAQQIEV